MTLQASRNATPQDWAEVMAAVRAGTLDARDWINHRTTLERVVTDLPGLVAAPGAVVKAVVELGEGA